MDKTASSEVNTVSKAVPLQPKKPMVEPEPAVPVFSHDAVDAERLRGVVSAAQAKPVDMTDAQLERLAEKKANCPFIGSAVAANMLAVRNTADRPLASIDDVASPGSTGGGDLGEVLKVFAKGNHVEMLGMSGIGARFAESAVFPEVLTH